MQHHSPTKRAAPLRHTSVSPAGRSTLYKQFINQKLQEVKIVRKRFNLKRPIGLKREIRLENLSSEIENLAAVRESQVLLAAQLQQPRHHTRDLAQLGVMVTGTPVKARHLNNFVFDPEVEVIRSKFGCTD